MSIHNDETLPNASSNGTIPSMEEVINNIDWPTKCDLYRIERDIHHLEFLCERTLREFYETPKGHYYLGMLSEKQKLERLLDEKMKGLADKWVSSSPH